MNKNSLDIQSVLKISNLFFSYGLNEKANNVIHDLSLTVKAGELVSILGGSGCGKSTLLNVIAGLLQPKAGTIEFGIEQKRKKQIGYIFQEDALLPWRTIESNLMLATEINQDIPKSSIEERIFNYLKTFHLSNDILNQYPSQLSGGMRQRISIIQALMFDPEIILLDEPFSALDFFTKLRLEAEVYQLIKEQNKAAILITHDIDEAIAISDSVMIMATGGSIINQFDIDFGRVIRSPEDVRGTTQFAEYYHLVWSQLRKVIEK